MSSSTVHSEADERVGRKESRSARTAYNPGVVDRDFRSAFVSYATAGSNTPLFLLGDAISILRAIPDASVDCVMTSPPYWGKREYANGGIGLEGHHADYVRDLSAVVLDLKRVLKPEGSFWLNIGDTYQEKRLLGIPWRVAFELTDSQGWILRNSIIWNKLKSGMDNSNDRLGNIYENVFHFVKQPKYYYNVNAIRTKARDTKIVNGSVVSATGVSGVRYKRQIELSTTLTANEKEEAYKTLNSTMAELLAGRISDFRMIIRGQQRATHSDSEKLSGRAKELRDKGFCILRYHPNGSKPTDVWDIIPEDTQRKDGHFAPYPTELCHIPILATCPEGGIVLDPFCGTGTTMYVAQNLARKSVGIDISGQYLSAACDRCESLL
jgi:site-specific DNA-methyltransferase (adenine-specific)